MVSIPIVPSAKTSMPFSMPTRCGRAFTTSATSLRKVQSCRRMAQLPQDSKFNPCSRISVHDDRHRQEQHHDLISIPSSEAHVIRRFQECMPYGLFAPDVL